MLCAMGGLRLQLQDNFILFRDKTKRLGLLAGGTDIAPIIPIIRAYSDHVRKNGSTVPLHGLNLIYAVEGEHDLANMQVLESKCCHLISYCSAYWTYCSSNQYIDVV
jgi:ferredoxin-NADP reductase